MPEEIERQIEQLPHGATPNSFRILAKWLKENRRLLESRMDAQDRKLELIYQETKRTNGRVADLERDRDLERAIRKERDHWATEREDELERAEAHERVAWTRREKWFATGLGVISTAAVVLQTLHPTF